MADEWRTTTGILGALVGGSRVDAAVADAAWKTLCDRFHKPIQSFARRIGLRDADAEDVAQETLLTFLEKHRSGAYRRARGRLTNWLFGVAHNKARQVRDRRRTVYVADRTDASVGFLERQVDVHDVQQAIWDEEWDKWALRTALDRVRCEFTEDVFRIFELVSLQGRKPGDVAAELGLKPQSVYDCRHRVLARLRAVRADLEEVELAGEDRWPTPA